MLTSDMQRLIVFALEEDLGNGDHTSASSVPDGLQREGFILAKEEGLVAGLEVATEVFRRVDADLNCKLLMRDGDRVWPGSKVMRISGSARRILEAERLALNFIQRMSGIATRTAEVVESLKGRIVKCWIHGKRRREFVLLKNGLCELAVVSTTGWACMT